MFKVLGLMVVATLIGCSNAAKKSDTKTTTDTKEAPATITTETKADTSKTPDKKDKKKTAVNAANAKGQLTCTSGTDVRTIATKEKGEGCELEYTKAQTPSIVASQVVGHDKCVEISARIQGKLEAAGYKCE